jgi:hypothetical protein
MNFWKIWWEQKVLSSDKKAQEHIPTEYFKQLKEISLKSINGPLWACWHQIGSNEPISHKLSFEYELAFQVVTIWCYSKDTGSLKTFLATEENQPQLLTFVFPKQYFLSCLVHILVFKWLLAILKPFSNDGIIRNPKNVQLAQKETWRGILKGNIFWVSDYFI